MNSNVQRHCQGLKFSCLDINALQAFFPFTFCILEKHMKNNHNLLWSSKSINVKRKLLMCYNIRKVYVFLTMVFMLIYIHPGNCLYSAIYFITTDSFLLLVFHNMSMMILRRNDHFLIISGKLHFKRHEKRLKIES